MTTEEKLEALFAKVRALPEPRQLAAIEALSEIAEEPHQLSEDELAVLRPALARARRGELCRITRWPSFSTSHGAEAPV